MKPSSTAAIIAASVTACIAVAQTTTYTALASADSSINPNDPTPNGAENALVVGESGGQWWSLVYWDFIGEGKVPANSTIHSVEFDFFRQCTSDTSSIFLEAGYATSDWDEFGSSAVRWSNRPGVAPVGTYPVQACSGVPRWITLATESTLEQSVQNMVTGFVPNNGFVFRPSPAATGAYQIFRSREDTPPRLIIEFTPPQPADPILEVTSVSMGGGPIGLCEEDFPFSVTIENTGGEAEDVRLAVRLGTSGVCGNGIYPVYSDVVGSIGAGDIRTFNLTGELNPSIPRQDYYLHVEAIVGGSELDCGRTSSRTLFERCADLVVGGVTTPSGPFAPGDAIMVGFEVENTGGIASEPTTYRILVSEDQIPGGDAFSAGPFPLSTIPGAANRTLTRTITLPASLSSGSYYLGAAVDDDGAFNDWAFTADPVVVSAACSPADLVPPFGSPLDIDDVLAFLNAFAAREPIADLAPPMGEYDIDDVLLFLTTFAAGCP